MRFGYETGGETALDGASGRRWPIVLLAFLLAAAALFLIVAPASADNDNGNGEETCQDIVGEEGTVEEGEECEIDNEGQAWEAVFVCGDGCELFDLDVDTPGLGEIANIDIDADGAYQVILTTTEKGNAQSPPPGRARVSKDGNDLPKCTGKTPTNCVKIKRVAGAFTEYTVKVEDDPRFRFR